MNVRARSVSIAVGVGDGTTHRSAVWRVWTNAKQSSVMVALCVSRRIKGGRFKVTLERSGTWRLAENETVARWERPDEYASGWTLALEIVVPYTEVVPPMPVSDVDVRGARWTPPFEGDGDLATAFRILISGPEVAPTTDDWPGNDGSGDAEVLLRGPLANGETMWLIRAKGEIGDDLRSELEEARHQEIEPPMRFAAQHGADAAVGRSFIKRPGEAGQLRIFELALRAFRTAQMVRDELEREPTPVDPGTMSLRLAAFLEDVFGHDWLATGPAKHSAVQQRRACQALMRRNGRVTLPADGPALALSALTLQDAMVLATIGGGDTARLRLGDLSGFGDEAVRRKLASRIHDAPQWEALMVELYMAAWYRRQGHEVTPFEVEGYPDLRVTAHDSAVATLIECKRLAGMSRSRVRTDIRNANRQIKRAAAELDSPYSGIVVLDVSAAVGFAEGSSEETPAAVREIERAAAAAMSGARNRSVREALIVWRYYRLQRAPAFRGFFAMRAVRHVIHAGQTRAVDSPLRRFAGTTELVGLYADPPS